MAHMPDFAREAAEVVFHHHHQPAATETETPSMTTPAPRNVLADLSGILGNIASSKLISQLVSEGLGNLLSPGDAEHVIALVRSLEAPHRQAAANVPPLPQRAPQLLPQPDGIAPQPVA